MRTDSPADVTFVMRIVATGGDRISMRRGTLIRNGEPDTIDGPQPCNNLACNFPDEITIPDRHFYVLGDNRSDPNDSRFWGPIPEYWVIGRYWFKVG